MSDKKAAAANGLQDYWDGIWAMVADDLPVPPRVRG